MELMVRDGDYCPDGKGGLRRAEGDQELLQRVLWKLSIRQGSFPFLPKLGSRLRQLSWEKPSAREALARQYVAQALEDEVGLNVVDTELEADGTLRVLLEQKGEKNEVVVRL